MLVDVSGGGPSVPCPIIAAGGMVSCLPFLRETLHRLAGPSRRSSASDTYVNSCYNRFSFGDSDVGGPDVGTPRDVYPLKTVCCGPAG